jgi:hypothetical protein
VLDQLVKGVIDTEDTEDAVELEELLPPAQATSTIGKTKIARFFKVSPLSKFRQLN